MSEEVTSAQDPEPKTIQLNVELPGGDDKISLSLGSTETIQEIKQMISSLPQSRKFTNFSLTYDSFRVEESLSLIEFIGANELEEVKELTLHLREDPYTERSAREHVLKVREILGLNSNQITSREGVFTGSSKFQELQLAAITPMEKKSESENEDSSKEFTAVEKAKAVTATENIVEKSKPLVVHSVDSQFSISPAIKSLAVSVWNPPGPQEALKGDLLYLQAQTLEGDVYQITSHVTGFFVNESSSSNFDGAIKRISQSGKKTKVVKSHSLLELLAELSPRLIDQVQKNAALYVETIPEVYLASGNNFLANPWLVGRPPKREPDLARSQYNFLAGGPDAADLSKDWNDEFQSVRELSRETFTERVMREKLLNRTSFEFTAAATKTAISIVRGELQPINPEEDPSLHVFLRNGIFYSFGVDAAEHFSHTGGNEAARAATSRDIASIRSLNKIDDKAVCHILTSVVDYCGQRVVCQAPVPGIFNNDSESSDEAPQPEKVVYGLTASGTALVVDDKFKQKFTGIGEAFHLKPHRAWNTDGTTEKEVVTSVETKGLRGTDGRDYIIDLYRTTPLDIEFIEKHWTPGHENSYPHREVTLRHEAVEEWWKRQVAVIVKKETDKLEAAKAAKAEIESAEKPTITIAPNEFALNPDAFSLDGSKASAEGAKELENDEERVREVSKFVTAQLIPEFLSDVSSSKSMAPIDGSHLTSLLHKRGINVRYLGYIADESLKLKEAALAKEASHKEAIKGLNEEFLAKEAESIDEVTASEKDNDKEKEKPKSKADFVPTVSALDALYTVAIHEMIARAVKHVLRDFISGLPLPLVPACIAHFHNCLLGKHVNDSPAAEVDDTLKHLYADSDFGFSKLTPDEVISLVTSEVFIRYRFTLPENWNDNLIKRISLLREVALKFGIQWYSHNYAFTKEDAEAILKSRSAASAKIKKSAKKTALVEESTEQQLLSFRVDDIAALYPVVKDSIFRSTLVEEIWEAGRIRIQSEEERDLGLSLLTEAVQFYEQIYGNIHSEVGKAYSVLGQTYHDLGLFGKACEISRKAAIILERTLGLDSYDTILALINTAFFEQANNNTADSLTIYARVLSDWSVVYGEEHPSVITTVTNVASLLQSRKLYKEAAMLLGHAVSLSLKTNGEISQITAMLRYQLSQYHLMGDDIDSALSEMKQSYDLFKITVGEDDSITQDSKKWLEALTTYKTRRDEVTAKAEQDAKKIENGSFKTKKVKKVSQVAPKHSKAKPSAKNQTVISVPDIANQSVDDILAFIEGQTPSKKKNKGK